MPVRKGASLMSTIDLREGWNTLFEGDHLRLLETKILPDFLPASAGIRESHAKSSRYACET